MLRLTISGIDAELYENAPVNIKLQYADVTKINNPQGSFTQTFRLPLTELNRTIFGNIDEPALVGGLNLQQRLTASLHSGSTPLAEGYVQIKAVYLTKEIYAEVEVAFFSGALDLKTELGGAFISDLDLSSYDHDLTYTNIGQSWIDLGISPEIRYGVIDKGNNWSSTNPIGTSTQGIPMSNLTPFVQAKVLVDTILAGAGFTYESTYLDSADFEQIYMPAWNGSQQVLPKDVVDENVRTTLASNQSLTGTYAKLNFSDTQAGCTDAGSNWNSTNDTYLVPTTGVYSIRFTHSLLGTSGLAVMAFRVVYGSTTDTEQGVLIASNNELYTLDNVTLTAGDTIYVEAKVTNGAGAAQGSANFNTGSRTSLEVIAGEAFGGYEVGTAENLPEMKQIDFLTSLQKMFNLVFVPDPNKPNHLLIDTYENYTASGANKDWTNKVDYGKDVTIKPTTDIQSQVYEWTHKEGKDFISLEVQKSLDRVYGRQRIIESENDFATGELVIQTEFAPYILSLVTGTSVPLFRGLTADGTGVQDPLPMLAYWCGIDAGNTIYFQDETDTTRSTSFPTFSNYNNKDLQVTSKDLNFGVERPLFDIAVNARDTLYIRFWAQYVTELYSSDARIMTCSVRLDEADIADLKFNDKVYVNDAFYRILSVSFDANTPSLAKVQLIKKLDGLSLCADTPTSLWQSQNIILFNGSIPGGPDYGGKTCCEYYGYRWEPNRSATSVCRPNTAQLQT
jgi:hypothetical protein